MKQNQRETLRLLLTGLLASEGIGSSVEFIPQSQIPAEYAKLKSKGWPFEQVGGGPFNWQPGEPTDDGAQSICLVRSFLELGRFDPEDVALKLVEWINSDPPDVGGTTCRTLERLRDGSQWYNAAFDDFLRNPKNAANGSVMRNGVMPGICFGQGRDLLFRATVQHSIITHYAPLPVLCCAIQSWIIADLLYGWGQGPTSDPKWIDWFFDDWTRYIEREDDPHVGLWIDRTRSEFQSAGEEIEAATWTRDTFNPFATDFSGRAGYCVLTLQIAVWALLWSVTDEPYPVPPAFPEEVFDRRGSWVMTWPAMVGFDTDTYGAVAGPILAAAHKKIPSGLASFLETHILA